MGRDEAAARDAFKVPKQHARTLTATTQIPNLMMEEEEDLVAPSKVNFLCVVMRSVAHVTPSTNTVCSKLT